MGRNLNPENQIEMKAMLAINMCLLVLNTKAQIPEGIPTEGLVGWFMMNGNGVNEASSQLQGELNQVELAVDRFGEEGGGLSFLGQDSHVNLGNSDELISSGALTFATWMNPSHLDAYTNNAIIGKNTNESSNYGVTWTIHGPFDSRVLRLSLGDASNGGIVDDIDFPFDVQEGVWQHYAVTFDSESDSVKFYMNGSFVGAQTTTVNAIYDNGQDTFIGKLRPNGGSCQCQWYTGLLDDLGMWDRALSPEEISALYSWLPVEECLDDNACNYGELEPCEYAQLGYDCDGMCIQDLDEDGVCDECEEMDPLDPDVIVDCFCNFDEYLVEYLVVYEEECLLEISCDCECYFDEDGDGECDEIIACMDWTACNFNPLAVVDDGSCLYEGDPCDDEDPSTLNDLLDENCDCVGGTVGTQSEAIEFEVYPNPASGSVKIQANSFTVSSVQIIDASGRVVLDAPRVVLAGGYELDLSGIDEGNYQIVFASRGSVQMKTIAIMR